MRVPPFESFPRLLSSLGLLSAGIVIGGALYMSVHHQNVSHLAIENAKLLTENKKLRDDIEQANKTRSRQTVIKQITVHVVPGTGKDEIDEKIANDIRAQVLTELAFVRGKPVGVFKLDPLVYQKLVETKKIRASDNLEYRVRVRSMIVIQSDLTVWITPFADTPGISNPADSPQL